MTDQSGASVEACPFRRFGVSTTHLVSIDLSWLIETTWIGPPYMALHEPAVALCRAVLRPDERGLVRMKDGTTITCRTCRRLDPITEGEA